MYRSPQKADVGKKPATKTKAATPKSLGKHLDKLMKDHPDWPSKARTRREIEVAAYSSQAHLDHVLEHGDTADSLFGDKLPLDKVRDRLRPGMVIDAYVKATPAHKDEAGKWAHDEGDENTHMITVTLPGKYKEDPKKKDPAWPAVRRSKSGGVWASPDAKPIDKFGSTNNYYRKMQAHEKNIEKHLGSSAALLPEKISKLQKEVDDPKTTDTKKILDLKKQIRRAEKAFDTHNIFKDGFVERWKALHSEHPEKEFLPDPLKQKTEKRSRDVAELVEEYGDMGGVYNKLTKTPSSQTPDDIKGALGQARSAWTELGDAPTTQQKQAFIDAFKKLPSKEETLASFEKKFRSSIGGAYDNLEKQHASLTKKVRSTPTKSPVKAVVQQSTMKRDPLPLANHTKYADELRTALTSSMGVDAAARNFARALGMDPESPEFDAAFDQAEAGKHPSQKTKKRKPRTKVKKSKEPGGDFQVAAKYFARDPKTKELAIGPDGNYVPKGSEHDPNKKVKKSLWLYVTC